MSAPGDIDPARLSVEPKPKRRRRKRRDRPEPAAPLKADQPKVEARLRRLPLAPGIMLEPREDRPDGWVHTAPHSDRDLWDAQLHAAFGTRSRSLVKVFVGQLKRLCTLDWDETTGQWKTNETELNAAIALVSDIQPRNSVEAALAAQLVSIHLLEMRLAESALNRGGMVMERDAALAGKLARTFAQQVERLQSLRGGKKPIRQTIIVKRENHVHYHDHRGRGGSESGAQPHATDGAAVIETRRALPGPDEGGDVVPITGRSRKAGV